MADLTSHFLNISSNDSDEITTPNNWTIDLSSAILNEKTPKKVEQTLPKKEKFKFESLRDLLETKDAEILELNVVVNDAIDENLVGKVRSKKGDISRMGQMICARKMEKEKIKIAKKDELSSDVVRFTFQVPSPDDITLTALKRKA